LTKNMNTTGLATITVRSDSSCRWRHVRSYLQAGLSLHVISSTVLTRYGTRSCPRLQNQRSLVIMISKLFLYFLLACVVIFIVSILAGCVTPSCYDNPRNMRCMDADQLRKELK